MKCLLAFLALSTLTLAEDVCPHDQEVQCITDVNKAFDVCDKAAKAKGKDQTADIACIKYFSAVEKDCWPCICKIAKDNDYKIKGCDKIVLY